MFVYILDQSDNVFADEERKDEDEEVAQFSYYIQTPFSALHHIPRGHKYFIKIKLSREKKSTH